MQVKKWVKSHKSKENYWFSYQGCWGNEKTHAQINLSRFCKPEEHKLLYQRCLQTSPSFEFSDRFSNSEVTNLDNSTDWLRIWAFVLPVTDLGQSDVNLTCLCYHKLLYHKLLGGQSTWVQKVREEAEKMRTTKRWPKKRGQQRRGQQRGGWKNEYNKEEESKEAEETRTTKGRRRTRGGKKEDHKFVIFSTYYKN